MTIFLRLILVSSLVTSVTAQAQQPVTPSSAEQSTTTTAVSTVKYKIGYVNTGKVLQEAPQARNVEERLKTEFLKRDKILKEKQQELLEIENRLKQPEGSLSASEKRKLERELRLKLSQLKFEQQEFKEDQNLRRNEEIRKLQTVIANALKQIGDDKKFDLILTEGVSYVSDAVDITTEIIMILRDQSQDQQQP